MTFPLYRGKKINKNETLNAMLIDCECAVANILYYGRKEDGTVQDAENISNEQREELIKYFADQMRSYNKK